MDWIILLGGLVNMEFTDILRFGHSDSETIKETEQKKSAIRSDVLPNDPLKEEPKINGVSEIGFTDEAASEDKFGIINYIGGLANFISVCSTPLTISIQGSWGTGKTSIMNLVKQQLPDDVFPVWFNTWQFSQFNMSEQLPVSLLTSLLSAFELKDKKTMDDANKIIKALRIGYRMTKGFGIAAIDSIVGGKIADGVKAGVNRAESELSGNVNDENDLDPAISIKRLKEEFIKCVNITLEEKNKRRIVIFIDDLDRLNPEKAVELLEVLKLFLDCKNCVFVLAIDYDVVFRGVKEKYGEDITDEKGRSFFDKIIQVPFKMPIARYKIEEYVKDCFKQIDIGVNNKEEVRVYVDLIKYSIGTNPRSMKRLFNAFQLLIEIVRQEGADGENKKDIINDVKYKQLLFAILCLQHCSEKIYNFLILNKDSLTVEMFESLISDNYDTFIGVAERGNADIEELEQIDFDSAKPFLGKLKEAIDLNGNRGIEKKELENFIKVIDFTTVTNATDNEMPKTTNRGSELLTDYTELKIQGNPPDRIKDIMDMIKRIGEDIEIQLVRRKSGDCMRGVVNGNNSIVYIYGRSKGYRIYIIAPKAETLADAEIAQLIQNMDIKIDSSWPKEIPITVTRNERVHEVEDNIIKLGQLVYNEWKKKA